MKNNGTVVQRVEKIGKVELVLLERNGFVSWAVYGPDLFNRWTYWTQPNEKAAREFFIRLIDVV